jgi:restriction endonuclease S subunit
MIIDNLKDINCVADLFRYIANIEEENERLHKQIDTLLIQLNNKSNRPEVGFKKDFKNYNIELRKREI